MKAGMPAARTMEECWDMVNTSEATQRAGIQSQVAQAAGAAAPPRYQ